MIGSKTSGMTLEKEKFIRKDELTMKKTSILLVGIGGYGNNYVKAMLEEGESHNAEIIGAVEPYPESCRYLNELKERKIPIFASLEDFYVNNRADLVVISSPIHFHSRQTCISLEYGSNVLCEKPAAATVQEVNQMIETRDRTNLIVAIGFQWAYDPPFQLLKRDVMNGLLGKPKRLKTLVLWPRDTLYYKRVWAGKIKDTDGSWILDSVANNATAHFLHNMLHLLGKREELSTNPIEVTAELYRANPIENFDTSAIRVLTQDNVEILFYASHAVKSLFGPTFLYEFEDAIVAYNEPSFPESSNKLIARFRDGRVKDYGSPNHQSIRKLWVTIDAIRGLSNIPCPLESAKAHTLCINGAHDSMPEIVNFPDKLIRREGNPVINWVEGLEDVLKECYKNGILPSEANIIWAKSGEKISLIDYNFFPKNVIDR